MCDYFETFVLACTTESGWSEQLDDFAILSIVFDYAGDSPCSLYLVEETDDWEETCLVGTRAFSAKDAVTRLHNHSINYPLNVFEVDPDNDIDWLELDWLYTNYKGNDATALQFLASKYNILFPVFTSSIAYTGVSGQSVPMFMNITSHGDVDVSEQYKFTLETDSTF